jgi:hypothetical protein
MLKISIHDRVIIIESDPWTRKPIPAINFRKLTCIIEIEALVWIIYRTCNSRTLVQRSSRLLTVSKKPIFRVGRIVYMIFPLKSLLYGLWSTRASRNFCLIPPLLLQ